MSSAAAGYVGGLIAVALVSYLAATAGKRAPLVNGVKALCYGPRVRLLGWVLLAMVTPIVGFFFSALWHVPSNQIPFILIVALVMLMLPVALLLEFYGVHIAFDNEAIRTRSPWRRSREIPWSDVISCKYSAQNRWYVLGTKANGNIRVSSMLSGVDEFLTLLKKKSPQL